MWTPFVAALLLCKVSSSGSLVSISSPLLPARPSCALVSSSRSAGFPIPPHLLPTLSPADITTRPAPSSPIFLLLLAIFVLGSPCVTSTLYLFGSRENWFSAYKGPFQEAFGSKLECLHKRLRTSFALPISPARPPLFLFWALYLLRCPCSPSLSPLFCLQPALEGAYKLGIWAEPSLPSLTHSLLYSFLEAGSREVSVSAPNCMLCYYSILNHTVESCSLGFFTKAHSLYIKHMYFDMLFLFGLLSGPCSRVLFAFWQMGSFFCFWFCPRYTEFFLSVACICTDTTYRTIFAVLVSRAYSLEPSASLTTSDYLRPNSWRQSKKGRGPDSHTLASAQKKQTQQHALGTIQISRHTLPR